MSKNDGEPAFPITAGQQVYAQGITMRDWFAGQALAGIISTDCSHEMNVNHRAELSYRLADAMIAARDA